MRAAELAEKVRESRFSREVVGPRVAGPFARWLTDTFDLGEAENSNGAPLTAAAETTDVAQSTNAAPAPEADGVARDVDDAAHADEAADVVGAEVAVEADADPAGAVPYLELPWYQRFVAVVRGLVANIKDHNLVVVAAGIAFWGLLAIPAVLFSVVSIAGLVVDPDTIEQQVNDSLSSLPDEVKTIIGGQLANVSGGSTGGLITGLVLGLVLALWSSSGAVAKLMATLNTIYGTLERRSFVHLRGLALALTLGGIVFTAGAMFLLAVLPSLLASISAVGDSAADLFEVLRFPALALVTMIAFGVLYHLGPDRRSGRYRVFTIGALVATVLWVALSGLFSIYTATLGTYNETYGTLGGLVVLLLWLFITAFVVLIGAEIHALTGRDQPGRLADANE
ncbi:MAG: YihY/virulence factor BrkB family protein [Actinomycetota bacterium]